MRRLGTERRGIGSRSRPRMRLLHLLALMLVLSLIAAACASDGDPVDTTAAPGGGQTTTTAGGGEETTTTAAADRGTAADAFDGFNAMTGQARTDALIAAAQEEGSVTFYTASSGMDPVIEAFEDTYDVNVDVFAGTSDTVLQRIMQEYEAGFYGIDVFDDAEAYTIAREGLTYEYINPELTKDIPGYDPA